jgi:hypothetical protein
MFRERRGNANAAPNCRFRREDHRSDHSGAPRLKWQRLATREQRSNSRVERRDNIVARLERNVPTIRLMKLTYSVSGSSAVSHRRSFEQLAAVCLDRGLHPLHVLVGERRIVGCRWQRAGVRRRLTALSRSSKPPGVKMNSIRQPSGPVV